MYCYNCGKEVNENDKFCPYCGTQLHGQTGNQGNYESSHQEHYPREDDAPSGGFAFLSFVVPIVGLVLYLIWNKDYPLKAKSCLKGFIASIVLEILLFCCGLSFAGSAISHHSVDFNHAVIEVVPYE